MEQNERNNKNQSRLKYNRKKKDNIKYQTKKWFLKS